MKTVKEKLRYLKNTAESCKSIPKDYRGRWLFTQLDFPSP